MLLNQYPLLRKAIQKYSLFLIRVHLGRISISARAGNNSLALGVIQRRGYFTGSVFFERPGDANLISAAGADCLPIITSLRIESATRTLHL